MFSKLFPAKKDKTPEKLSGIVRVIGARASGKTTYMAALIRQPNFNPSVSVIKSVTPLNDEGEELIRKAGNVLEEGDSFSPTDLNSIDEVKDYGISISVRKEMGGSAILNVNCKDYAGEFFQEVIYRQNDPLLDDYIQDCVFANGLMILVDGMSFRQDQKYALGLERLLTLIDQSENKITERRIALVLTKCEQPELWVHRDQPQLIAQRFPEMLQKLQIWESQGPGKVDYFATSAFGMLGSRNLRPNVDVKKRDRLGIQTCVLKQPKNWQPFGLVAPIYWLCTGKRHSKLDKE